MTVGAVVPAAGSGSRLGGGEPKALRLLLGEPLLVHAVRRLRDVRGIGPVVVAAPPAQVAVVGHLLAAYDVTVVAGGEHRQQSVLAGLAALPAEVDLVLVHDAARALVPVRVVEAVVAALRDGAPAVVPGLPLTDTVKQVDADERVVATPARAALRAVQTPQGFSREVLDRAHRAAGSVATDDATLVELLGLPVRIVPGAPEAFKITVPFDLLVAEAVLRA